VLNRQKLDQVLDFENDGVSKHLGQIADTMYEWEGPIAERLGLTRADVAAIKTKHPGKLKLQTWVNNDHEYVNIMWQYTYLQEIIHVAMCI
jgi:hypothetical protein